MIPLRDTAPRETFPLVNWILIGLNVLMFIGELSLQAQGRLGVLIFNFGVVPARFLHYHDAAEFMTLFTSMFLHGGWIHLLGNMLVLYIFGDNLEDRLGPARYLLFYLTCGIAAELAQVLMNADSLAPGIGASGAIAGVLGGYLVLFPRARVLTLLPIFYFFTIIEIPAVFYLGFWFISQLFSGTLEIVHGWDAPGGHQTGGIAVWAHAGGFIVGALLVRPFEATRGWRHPPPRRYVRV